MEQYIEFATNNWMLVGTFAILLILWLVYELQSGTKSLSSHEATMMVNRQDGVFLDVRDRNEFKNGHIAGAVNISLASLKERTGELEKYKDKPVIVVCKMGTSAGTAVTLLKQAGFEQARNLRGGMSQWQSENLPVVKK
ncbi:rhodanese-like domain-containing protein [Oceanospirillum sediminis]|nr:rhodanese-like domain-containing protein [Oceanospirillum sediminis]